MSEARQQLGGVSDRAFVAALALLPSVAITALASYVTGAHIAATAVVVVPAVVLLAATRVPASPRLSPEAAAERAQITRKYVGRSAAIAVVASAVVARVDILPDVLQLFGVLGFWFGGPLAAYLVSRQRLRGVPERDRAAIEQVLREEFYGVRLDALRKRRGVMWWSLLGLTSLIVTFAAMAIVVLALS